MNQLPIAMKQRRALVKRFTLQSIKFHELAKDIARDKINLEELTESLISLGINVDHEFSNKKIGTFLEGFCRMDVCPRDIALRLTRMSDSMQKDNEKFKLPAKRKSSRQKIPTPSFVHNDIKESQP